MILLKKNTVFYITGFLVLVCIPFIGTAVFYDQVSGEVDQGFIISGNLAVIVPLALLLELLIYFVVGLITGVANEPVQLIQYCFLMAFMRFLACFIAGNIFSILGAATLSSSMLLLWMANPYVVIIQILVIMMFSPHLIADISSSAISEEARRNLGKEPREGMQKRPEHFHIEGEPVGGFIRVYSFEELGRLISNIVGVEGFVLYTWEGLVLWENCQLSFDMEKVVVTSQKAMDYLTATQDKIGMGAPSKVLTRTDDHYFLNVQFNDKFCGVIILKSDVNVGEILQKFSYIEKSATEFFEMKYSPLI